MQRAVAGIRGSRLRSVVAWSLVLVSVLPLASLFHAVVGRAVGEPTITSSAPSTLSPVTAALSDGDDVRARFLARLTSDPSRPDSREP